MNGEKILLVVVATYNEVDSIGELVRQIFSQIPSAEILVVDDNSPDGTGAWCREYAVNEPRLSTIHRSGKLGLGSATIAGLTHALNNEHVYVATMDADLSHDPGDLRWMLDSIRELRANGPIPPDVVIGSRYVQGGKIIGWPAYRRISSYLVNMFAQLAIGLRTKDNTSAFRIYSTDALRKIDLSSVHSSGYSYLEELLLLLKKSGATFKEFPITFNNRQFGRSKVNVSELARSLYQILRLSLHR